MRVKSGLLISICAVGLVAACVQQQAAEPAVSDATDVVETDTKSKVKLAPPITTVKPGASVTISHDDLAAIAVGENGSVTLTVNEGYPGGTLILQATGEAGLDVFGAQTSVRLDMTDVTTHTWRVSYAGETDGMFHINLMATADMGDGYSETRAFAVPVKVGDWENAQAKVQAASDVQILDSGEAAVIMEAEETIE